VAGGREKGASENRAKPNECDEKETQEAENNAKASLGKWKNVLCANIHTYTHTSRKRAYQYSCGQQNIVYPKIKLQMQNKIK